MSHKLLDPKNRWRNKTVSFRVSPQEADTIDRLALLSGMTKQDYLCARCLQQNITVVPNPRVQRGLHQMLTQIGTYLQDGRDLPTEIVESLPMLITIIKHLDSLER